MPSGNFTKQWITIKCGFCSKEIKLSKGKYEGRIKRTQTGLLFCSLQCKNDYKKGHDIRDTKLICKRCGKDFTHDINKYAYTERLGQITAGIDIFCTRKCHVVYMDQDPEKIRQISEKQRYIPAPQRGRKGHTVSDDAREKMRISRLGVPSPKDNDIVLKEMEYQQVSKYANLTKRPIPDAVFFRDGKLIAVEVEKEPWEAGIRTKMNEYLGHHDKWDKVILVWYLPDGTRMKQWVLENGSWTLTS